MTDTQHSAQRIGEDAGQSDSPAVMVSACLSLGFFLAWATLGWNHGGTAFGMPLESDVPFHICLQAAIALTFFGLSFAKPTANVCTDKPYAAMGTAIAIVAVLASWIGASTDTDAVRILASILAGSAQALFMWAWLHRYHIGTGHVFTIMAAASGIAFLVHLFVLLFDNAPSCALSIILPPLALVIFVLAPWQIGSFRETAGGRGSQRTDRALSLPWTAGLLLCCLAGGVASFSMSFDSDQAFCLTVLVSFGFSAIGLFIGPARTAPLLVCLSLGVCVCVALALVVPQLPEWVSGLTFAGFWLLEVYALAWFSQREGKALSSGATRYLAVVYALSAAANIVGLVISEQAACTAALVLTVAAFAMTSFDAGRTSARELAGGAQPDPRAPTTAPLLSESETATARLAHRFGLTEAEQGVFAYLARGYSLKQIALELHISESTAKYHRRNVYQKCGVTSRQELINLVENMMEQDAVKDSLQ